MIGVIFIRTKINIWEALGISLCSTGLTSLLLSIYNYIDLKDSKTAEIISKIDNLPKAICSANTSYYNDFTLKSSVEEIITKSCKQDELLIDVMGITLNRFYGDQIRTYADEILQSHKKNTSNTQNILKNEKCKIRLIIQLPESNNLNFIAQSENMNAENIKKEIKNITKEVIKLNKELEKIVYHAEIEIKFYPYCPHLTITRVNKELYVQVRNIGGITQKSTVEKFFNSYNKNIDKSQFEYMMAYFDEAWNLSKTLKDSLEIYGENWWCND